MFKALKRIKMVHFSTQVVRPRGALVLRAERTCLVEVSFLLTVLFPALLFLGALGFAKKSSAAQPSPAVQTSTPKKVSDTINPYTLFFPAAKNGVTLEKQQIDYDLTTANALRVGPYFLSSEDVAMYLTKERGEFYDIEFGFDLQKKLGPMYVASFRWPVDYIDQGHLEIQNDRGEVLWKRQVTPQDISDWKGLIEEQRQKKSLTKERIQDLMARRSGRLEEDKTVRGKFTFTRPETLNVRHLRSEFGFAYKAVFELPIYQIREPFRFCISKEYESGRLGLCSRRYNVVRQFGEYSLRTISTEVRPRVLVNDRPVTLKGSAIFLDFATPIKFSALLNTGTYYEFISKPKDIQVVELIHNREAKKIEVIGYGDAPMGDVDNNIFNDDVLWGFLNFMPTIGDRRRYWRAYMPYDNPILYLKGDGGVPFRQRFVFNQLPPKEARIQLTEKTQKSTYESTPELEFDLNPKFRVSGRRDSLRKISERRFEWEFNAKEKGQTNIDELTVHESGKRYVAEYPIYRGYAAELSGRFTAILSADLDLIFLGEAAGQYWFEDIFGWENSVLSKLRWGVSAKYFDTLMVQSPRETGFSSLNVLNVDLKYRLDPGIWARDPSVGLIFATQDVSYKFKASGVETIADTTMYGGGVFWARSMPEVFDRIFNLVPFMRYPKWVDMEAILYPIILDSNQRSVFSLAFNFHGKVQWTPQFFGEAGFGLKNFAWEDTSLGAIDGDTGQPTGKSIGLAVAYGTVGLGFNF